MMRAIALVCLAVSMAAPALALDPPPLPNTAVKQFKNQIVALYDKRSYRYKNYTQDQLLSGVANYDFTAKTVKGTYRIGAESGRFRGAIRMRGDRFCYTLQNEPEFCVSIYRDGATVYEVDSQSVVTSVNVEKR